MRPQAVWRTGIPRVSDAEAVMRIAFGFYLNALDDEHNSQPLRGVRDASDDRLPHRADIDPAREPGAGFCPFHVFAGDRSDHCCGRRGERIGNRDAAQAGHLAHAGLSPRTGRPAGAGCPDASVLAMSTSKRCGLKHSFRHFVSSSTC